MGWVSIVRHAANMGPSIVRKQKNFLQGIGDHMSIILYLSKAKKQGEVPYQSSVEKCRI